MIRRVSKPFFFFQCGGIKQSSLMEALQGRVTGVTGVRVRPVGLSSSGKYPPCLVSGEHLWGPSVPQTTFVR